jgi:2-oxoglutarate ferredoxin oxidoreductase subunit delta
LLALTRNKLEKKQSFNNYNTQFLKAEIGMKGYIEINQGLCKGCEICISFCPKGIIILSDKLNAGGYLTVVLNDNGECTGCAICAVVCPEVAIEVYRD